MLFDSNVFNMIDWFTDGVEPRTGMYIRTIPIATLPSNSIQGPILNFTLYFNQFNNIDYGFGVGWEMSLAHIDSNADGTRTLVLSNGNRYKILSESGSVVTLQYKVTKNFNFVKDSTDSYRIINKDGSIETIQGGRVCKITAPNGKAILFVWNTDQSFTVTDSGGVTLVSSKLVNKVHVITTQQCTLNLQFSDPATNPVRALLKVQEGNGNALTSLYEMTSQLHNSTYYCLSEFTSTINYYQNETLTYTLLAGPPGISGSIMAVGTRNTFWHNEKTKEKTEKITIKTNYAYLLANYLGYPLTEKWAAGVDNLEKNHAFEFATVESTDGMRKYTAVTIIFIFPSASPLWNQTRNHSAHEMENWPCIFIHSTLARIRVSMHSRPLFFSPRQRGRYAPAQGMTRSWSAQPVRNITPMIVTAIFHHIQALKASLPISPITLRQGKRKTRRFYALLTRMGLSTIYPA